MLIFEVISSEHYQNSSSNAVILKKLKYDYNNYNKEDYTDTNLSYI